MIEFRNALSDIVDEFGTDDGGFQVISARIEPD